MPRIVLSLFALFVLFAIPAVGADFRKGLDAYDKGDYAIALREFRPLAEQGDAPAQHNLGVMYAQGYGVVKENRTAVGWFRKAAEQGHAPAQSDLGLMYMRGQGVLRDVVLAHMWWTIVSSLGNKSVKENKYIKGAKEHIFLIEHVMSPADISKSKNLAHNCVKKKYKGC